MGNIIVFVVVILAGIYAFYLIYRQIKHGKCLGCSEKECCPGRNHSKCPPKTKTKR